MKKLVFIVALVIITLSKVAIAQNVGINSTGSAPDASAMLDVSSTTSGFLAPRMTASQRAAISSPAIGLLVYQTDEIAGYYYYTGLIWTSLGNTGTTPVGTVTSFAGSTAPDGYLICNGSAVSRTTYSGLFAVIGTTYGAGDGSTTFNLPDMRGKGIVGYKSGDTDFGALNQSGGEKNHTLTTSEMPDHTHTVDPASQTVTTGSGSAHTHTVNPAAFTAYTSSDTHNHSISYVEADGTSGDGDWRFDSSSGSYQSTPSKNTSNDEHNHSVSINVPSTTSSSESSHTHSVTINIPSTTSSTTGSGAAHNVLDPYITLNYIIKY